MAKLQLNSLKIQSLSCTDGEFATKLASHYSGQFMGQIYKLVGSTSALGNPVGLFSSISTGVTDFFYEPAQGAIQSPSSFAKGLAKGSASLAGNITSGISDSTSKLTGSIGAGLAYMSADEQYQLELQVS